MGWLTTFSDSLVVKPTPVKAERAWNFADSRDRPVWVSATVAIRVTNMETVGFAGFRKNQKSQLFGTLSKFEYVGEYQQIRAHR